MSKKPYDSTFLIDKLKDAAVIFGDNVTCQEMAEAGFPQKAVYQKSFGSFNEAKKVAGLTTNHSGPRAKCTSMKKRVYKGRTATLKLRILIFERDFFKCHYCGRAVQDGAKLVIDHIYPFGKKGATTYNNLITSCCECNRGKRDILLHKFSLKKEKPNQYALK